MESCDRGAFAIGVLAFLIILKPQIPDSGEGRSEKDRQGRKMKGNYLWIVMVGDLCVYLLQNMEC